MNIGFLAKPGPGLAKSNKESPIIPLAVVALGLILGYFYYSQFGSQPLIIPEAPRIEDDLAKLGDLKALDLTIFQNAAFTGLKKIGQFPLPYETGGRSDPFAPF